MAPLKLDIGEVLSDTYESREDVRTTSINRHEEPLEMRKTTGHAVEVVFVSTRWGAPRRCFAMKTTSSATSIRR